MNTKKSAFRMISVLLFITVLLTGTLPVQAESLTSLLPASGDHLWAKKVGGGGYDSGNGIEVDASGNVYTTGYFNATVDFDPGAGVVNLTSAGNVDVFVSKLDKDGNLVWARNMGGTGGDVGNRIAVDSSGNVYTTGVFQGTADFDPGAGTENLTSAGGRDIFISKLDSAGNFVWAKRMGGTGAIYEDHGRDIAVDSNGNVYTTGYFEGTVDFDPGAGTANLVSAGDDDVFISKLDANGNFIWAKAMSGWSVEEGHGIALDSNGNIYITGLYYVTVDFDPGAGTVNLTSTGGPDIFVSKLDGNGNLIWAKSMGSADATDWAETGTGIAVDPSGQVYTTGRFRSTADFDPGAGSATLSSAGSEDIFVSKLDGNGNFVWAKGMGGTGTDFSWGIAVDSSGNAYTTGYFVGSADFDPGAGTANLTSSGLEDMFISKLDSNGGFVWAKKIGGASYEAGESIAVDAGANVYTTGYFMGTVDFDPGTGTANLTSAGGMDIFFSKLEGNGVSTFVDVPLDHPLYKYIEALYDAGYTAGCSSSPMMFCPDTILDRAQSAVFMLRGQKGSGYTPPAVTGIFGDNWTGFEWAQGWAEGMYQEGLTTGCQSSPLLFCPANQLPRVEASIFGLRMKYGVGYTPPAASGTLFADFPSTDPSYWGIGWAEQAYNDGLLPACGTDSGTGKPMFCPSELVNRGWGAYLIVKAKNLPLP